MQVLERLKIQPTKKSETKVQAIIVRVTPSKNSYNGEILGRSLVDWVAFACNKLNKKVVDFSPKSSLIELAKNNIDSSYDYSIILMSTTPLLTADTIDSIIEYAVYKDVNLCKLPVGYIVKNSYMLSGNTLDIDSLYSQNLEEFFLVESKKQYVEAEEILPSRINSFHMRNGVEIERPKNTYIGPEVDIEPGVIIMVGNVLKGHTKIGAGVILKENNVVSNSKIGADSCVAGASIEESILGRECYVSSYSTIKHSIVGDRCIIGAGCHISRYNLAASSKLNANTILGEDNK